MTANVMQADIDKCIDAGMNDHVAKPIDPDELFGKLVKWVKPRQAGPPQEERCDCDEAACGGTGRQGESRTICPISQVLTPPSA